MKTRKAREKARNIISEKGMNRKKEPEISEKKKQMLKQKRQENKTNHGKYVWDLEQNNFESL
jgi:hypothetical protein